MDSEEPGDYVNLLADFQAAGISVSVIGLGRPTDVDADFLRDVARRGGGDVYFCEDPNQLPQLFTLDTINQTRKPFILDPPTNWEIRLASQAISRDNVWRRFFLGRLQHYLHAARGRHGDDLDRRGRRAGTGVLAAGRGTLRRDRV